MGEGLCCGQGVEERGGGGVGGWVGDERLSGGDDAEERAGHCCERSGDWMFAGLDAMRLGVYGGG